MAKTNIKNKKYNSNKNTSNNNSNKMTDHSKIKKSRNIWKVLAIVFVVLFIVIMAVGILRSHRFREHPAQLTAAQIDSAKNLALSDMKIRGTLPANYTIKTFGFVRPIENDKIKRNVTEVSIYTTNSKTTYIIDVNSEKIIVYSKTEFFDGINHLNDGDKLTDLPPPRSPNEQREIPLKK